MYRRDNPETSAQNIKSSPARKSVPDAERKNQADLRARAFTETRTQPAVRPGTNAVGNTEQQRRINAERTAEHRRVQGTGASSVQRNGRTGSAPYITGGVQGRRVPPRKKRKAPLYIRILAWFYRHRKAALACVCVLLFISVTIPLAVYAASNGRDSDKADFEILSTPPSADDVISADPSGGAFDADLPESPADSDVPDEGSTESEDDSDESSSEEDTSADSVPEDTAADEPLQSEPEDTETKFCVTVGFYDREPITCFTGPATLREILYNAGYTLRESDRPSVSLDETIDAESWIMIDSVTYGTVTESEAIPFEVETVEVQTVPRGTTRTVTPGVYGSRDKVYTVQYVNGAETERTFEYEYVSSYPQNQVDYYGTGGTVYASDGSSYSYSYCIDVRATYYNIHGNTASGLPTSNSVMAVDPSVIPLGTYVYVKNDYYDMGVKIAADTGGAVKGNIIDIWMDENHPYYLEFAHQGVANMVAYVLD